MWRLDLDESFCFSSDILINEITFWYDQISTCADIYIQNDGYLVVSDQLVLSDNAKITIENGGVLIINGADAINADIEVKSGGFFGILNGGNVSLISNDHLKVKKGAILEIYDGSITTNN